MNEVLGGWFAGYVMGMISAAAVAFLARPGGSLASLRERALPEASPVAVGVVAVLGTTVLWTVVGLLLGSVYRVGGLADAGSGLGSPAANFSLAMAVVALLPLPVAMILAPRDGPAWVAHSAGFAVCFGWLMPWLAEAG